MSSDRYARQRLIRWWDQERLQKARVLVAGVGALGNELLKNLALLGVGELLLIDFDRIEPSNLSRMVLFDEQDVGRSKVEVAAEALARLNPALNVRTIEGDLFYDVGLGHFRHSDLVIGCLDNLAARSRVGLSCGLAGVPYLDGGMWSLGGEVRWFLGDDGPCFDCTLDAGDLARADERRSCSGFRDPEWDTAFRVPTVISTAAIIGGLLAQEAAKWLCGHAIHGGEAIVYNGQTLRMHRAELSRRATCLSSHRPYEQVHELPYRATELTARQLLTLVRDDILPSLYGTAFPANTALSLQLGRDFLLAFTCATCKERQAINRLWGQVLEDERVCPTCGAIRQPEAIQSLTLNSPYIDHTLAQLGVPPADALAIYGADEIVICELTGDLKGTKR